MPNENDVVPEPPGEADEQVPDDAGEVAAVPTQSEGLVPSDGTSVPQRRLNERKQARTRVHGRASLLLPGGVLLDGRVYDMTRHGISVLLDTRLVMKNTYTLQISIFQHGQLHNLSIQVLSIHESLVGQLGFKHGFQFVALTDDITRSIEAILG
jgi:hypothetical protein